MKIQIKVGLAVTGALAACSFFMSVYLVSGLLRKPSDVAIGGDTARHFALFLPQNRNYYFNDIMNGAQKSAAERGAVLSVHTIDPEGASLRMAVYSGVEGVVVCPDIDDTVIFESLMKLTKKKIPLILVNHNIPADQPWPFVGTNNFDFGKKAGSLINRVDSTPLKLAIIYSDKSPAIYAERELVEMGIHGVLGSRLSGPISVLHTDLNPRDAEKTVYQLLRSEPEVNTILFTDLNDTLAGTQALIDLNQVGRIHVVAFGNDPSIQHFIDKGIVRGSLVVNPSLMGYQAVKSLFELCSTGYTSTSVDTGIDVLDIGSLPPRRADRERRPQ